MPQPEPSASRLRDHVVAALLGLAITAGPAWALEPASTGVVVLHGKWGDPSQMRPIAEALEEAGFAVERPAMPWAGYRNYDRPYGEAMAEIAEAAGHLREKGARNIVICGQSLGGNATLGYGVDHADPAALVLIAPAHLPEGERLAREVAGSVARARDMVAAGEGGDTASFLDVNSGNRTRWPRLPATTYLSYYDPDGPAAMSHFAPAVKVTRIVWLPADQDPATADFSAQVLPRLPATAQIQRVDLPGEHLDAPQEAAKRIVDVLRAIPEPAAGRAQ